MALYETRDIQDPAEISQQREDTPDKTTLEKLRSFAQNKVVQLVFAVGIASPALAACAQDKPKPQEVQKQETIPVQYMSYLMSPDYEQYVGLRVAYDIDYTIDNAFVEVHDAHGSLIHSQNSSVGQLPSENGIGVDMQFQDPVEARTITITWQDAENQEHSSTSIVPPRLFE
ncbi:hypothetical protein ACFL3T_02510 [Patescibacteria group bacterium]